MRVSTVASQINMKWKYRPTGQTLEEFAESVNRSPENVWQYLESYKNAQTASLDAVARGVDEEKSSGIIDSISSPVVDEHDADYGEKLDELKDNQLGIVTFEKVASSFASGSEPVIL